MHLELIFKHVEGVDFHLQRFNVGYRRTSEMVLSLALEVRRVCVQNQTVACFCRCSSKLNFAPEFLALRRRS